MWVKESQQPLFTYLSLVCGSEAEDSETNEMKEKCRGKMKEPDVLFSALKWRICPVLCCHILWEKQTEVILHMNLLEGTEKLYSKFSVDLRGSWSVF